MIQRIIEPFNWEQDAVLMPSNNSVSGVREQIKVAAPVGVFLRYAWELEEVFRFQIGIREKILSLRQDASTNKLDNIHLLNMAIKEEAYDWLSSPPASSIEKDLT
jgi:hypothetical protein